MKVIMIPLSSVLKVDAHLAYKELENLKAYGLSDVEVEARKARKGELLKCITRFGIGALTFVELKQEIESVFNLANPLDMTKVWNSICVIDPMVLGMASSAEVAIKLQHTITFYSDGIDAAQFSVIEDQLKPSKIPHDKILFSVPGATNEGVLQKIIMDVKADAYVVVIGHTDPLTDLQIDALVPPNGGMVGAAKELEIVRLASARLNVMELGNIFAAVKEDQSAAAAPVVLRFSTMAAPVPVVDPANFKIQGAPVYNK